MRRTPNVAALAACVSLAFPGYLAAQQTDERIQRVESRLRVFRMDDGIPRATGEPLGLAERMRHHNVPGVSIAVIDNFEIAWAKGYGVRRAGGDEPVTPETLFQSASIGKPVTAAAVLSFYERGLLDLDADVNEKLKSWEVPASPWTETEDVTLRRLLSHRAGINVHGFRGYDRGDTIPTLLQILNGLPPANNEPIRVTLEPGTQWRYSGGGYMIVQQMLEDIVGGPFPQIMEETILQPSGMVSSVYATPLPDTLTGLVASAHDESGRPAPGGWYELACMGAGGGLWTTPSDVARFVIAIMRAVLPGTQSRSDMLLSRKVAQLMFTPEVDAYGPFRMGLGFLLEGEGRTLSIIHGGENQPGFLSLLVAVPGTGQGAVIMTNAMNGQALAAEILFAVEEEYHWPTTGSP